jgi:plasmid stabilization system protein ParE
MAEVRWSLEANDDVENALLYIVQNTPRDARRFYERLLAAAERLGAFPSIGRIAPGLESAGLREVIVDDYRVLYRVRDDIVGIAAVVHGARDLRHLAEERGWLLS